MFYKHQICINLTSLMIANVTEDAVLEKQTKKKKKLSFPGPRTFTKIWLHNSALMKTSNRSKEGKSLTVYFLTTAEENQRFVSRMGTKKTATGTCDLNMKGENVKLFRRTHRRKWNRLNLSKVAIRLSRKWKLQIQNILEIITI